MLPLGVHLRQVPGKIQVLASVIGTSFQVPFSANFETLSLEAFIHFSMLSWSFIASLKLKVSGLLTLALCADGGGVGHSAT